MTGSQKKKVSVKKKKENIRAEGKLVQEARQRGACSREGQGEAVRAAVRGTATWRLR